MCNCYLFSYYYNILQKRHKYLFFTYIAIDTIKCWKKRLVNSYIILPVLSQKLMQLYCEVLTVCFGCPLWTVTMFCSFEVCPVQLRHACVQHWVKTNFPQGDNKGILCHIVSRYCGSQYQHKLTMVFVAEDASYAETSPSFQLLVFIVLTRDQTCNITSESFPRFPGHVPSDVLRCFTG